MNYLYTLGGMFSDIFHKLIDSKSYAIGIAAGVSSGVASLVIPDWVMHQGLTKEHAVGIIILLAVFGLDWLCGSRLAKKSPKQSQETNTAIDSAIRDAVIILICIVAVEVDDFLQSRSIVFAFFTASFIYQNFKSVCANAYILGWRGYFPAKTLDWIFKWIDKWLDNEIKAKTKKYFPIEETKEKQDEK
ncbi:phage holin family protein [Latilactobacillus sakei]|uniref:phage holin family protein n=1 Tax=Latilactobacillus sakei TaxID=1599 RepID=UPI0030D1B159